jgi:uncharacterized protein YpuA (DUF1002 family)
MPSIYSILKNLTITLKYLKKKMMKINLFKKNSKEKMDFSKIDSEYSPMTTIIKKLNSEKEINFSLKNIKESLSNLWNSKKNSNISKKPTLSDTLKFRR